MSNGPRKNSLFSSGLLLLGLSLLSGCDTSAYDQSLSSDSSQPTEAANRAAETQPAGDRSTKPAERAAARPAPGSVSPSTTATADGPTSERKIALPEPLGAADIRAAPEERASVGAAQAEPQPLEVALNRRTAVALAQTLPSGTAMGFSVEYTVRGGRPNPESRYAWIITAADGESVALEVQLDREGTLQTFVPHFRPQQKPFSCFVGELTKEGQQRAISRKLDFPP